MLRSQNIQWTFVSVENEEDYGNEGTDRYLQIRDGALYCG